MLTMESFWQLASTLRPLGINFRPFTHIVRENKYHNGVPSMNYQQSSASPEFASQGSSSGREFCLWNFKGVVLILVDRLCVLVV